MFNNYIWQLYLNGPGKEAIKIFKENLQNTYTDNYKDFIYKLHKEYCPSEVISKDIQFQLDELLIDLNEYIRFFMSESYDFKEVSNYIQQTFLRDFNNNGKEAFEHFSYWMEYYTTYFSIEPPELFIPYYFKCNFNVLETISNEFEIKLPKIPAKKDYIGRLAYYMSICETFQDFRINYNMNPYELYAFIYDFAPKYIGGINSFIVNDIPDTNSAYFIGSSKDDIFLSKEDDIIIPWQCNPDTEVGDAIVMYLTSPVSAIDSIWRSVSVGFNDPFFYYYRCTYISRPINLDRIPLKKLKEDYIFSKLPIVRKNMQGINGVELSPSSYNRILDLSNSTLKRFQFEINNNYAEIANEKYVEKKLIIPLLKKLGYTEEDYKKQLYIRVGNNNHLLIPDFVVSPEISLGHQKADLIVEAKYSIYTKKLLEKSKTQARGYAKILNTKYSMVASREGIWLTTISDDYSDNIIQFYWDQLKNGDNFFKLYKHIWKNKL